MTLSNWFHLRKLENKDAKRILECIHDPEVTQYLEGDFDEISDETIEKYILTTQFQITTLTMAVVDERDEYLGQVMLKAIDDEALTAEFGIIMSRAAWGSGAALEAMKQIMRIAFNGMVLERVYWAVNPENERALRFYEKSGLYTSKIEDDDLIRYEFIKA